LEYEEFIEATKLENESYNKSQKEEFDLLRNKFMQYKQEQNQKQRDSYWEFQVNYFVIIFKLIYYNNVMNVLMDCHFIFLM